MTVRTNDYDFMRSDFELNIPLFIGNISYPTLEHAFQAMKTSDPDVRKEIADLPLQEARRLGRSVDLREGWDNKKISVMKSLVQAKFTQDSDLAQGLVDTGNESIQMIHDFDEFWGCREEYGIIVGENNLGKILEETREYLVSVLGMFPQEPEEDDSDEEPDISYFIKKLLPEEELSDDLNTLFSAISDVLDEADSVWDGDCVNLEDFKNAVDKLGEAFVNASQEIKETAVS